MRASVTRVLATTLWSCAVLATLAFVAMIVVNWEQSFGFRDALWIAALFVALFLGHATAGLLIARRQPGNAVGWLMLLAGLSGGLGFALEMYAYAALEGWPGQLPLGEVAAGIRSPLIVAGLFGIPGLVLLVFPTGTALNRRGTRFVRALMAGLVTTAALGAFGATVELSDTKATNPIAAPGALGVLAGTVGELFFLLCGVAVLTGGVAIVLRFRRSAGVERQQLKWFTSVAGIAGVFMGAFLVAELVMPPPDRPVLFEAFFLLGLVALVCLPAAIGVAVLRYRLYEIDRILSRTVSYAVVTVVLVGAYAGAVMVLGQALRPLAHDSDLAVAASTLLVAALFHPVRHRVQSAIDRRFDRNRHDARQAVEDFTVALRSAVDLDTVCQGLVSVSGRTMDAASVRVWLTAARHPAATSRGRL